MGLSVHSAAFKGAAEAERKVRHLNDIKRTHDSALTISEATVKALITIGNTPITTLDDCPIWTPKLPDGFFSYTMPPLWG